MQQTKRGPGRSRIVAAFAFLVILVILGLAVRGFWPDASNPTFAPDMTAAAVGSQASAGLSASPSGSPSVGPSGANPSASIGPSASAAASLPNFKHVYVIFLENKEYGRIVGSGQAPYMNSLIAKYGLLTNMFGERHPSQPNYIAFAAGDTLGTDSDGAYNLNAPNLFDQIETSGRTWKIYAQGYPGDCYRGSSAPEVTDGPGAPGDYARKHVPAISFTSISGNPARCANIVKLAGFDPAAADFEMIVPNQINDMHSSSVAAGDAFLKVFVPSILDSPAFADSVLFITFDEGDSDVNGGGRIATIVATPGMTPGTTFTERTDHYSMLRTIELAWGLPLLGHAATATTIDLGR